MCCKGKLREEINSSIHIIYILLYTRKEVEVCVSESTTGTGVRAAGDGH